MDPTIWPRIDAEIVLAVRALNLQGEDPSEVIGDRVDSQMWPDTRDMRSFPRILVTHENEREELLGKEGGMPGERAYFWCYPSRVWIVDVTENRHKRKNLYLKWRHTLLNHFLKPENWVFPTVPELTGIEVIPDIVFDERLPIYQHTESGIILRVKTTEYG